MRKIIVAPLNWGLGHASRCVPIIRSLLEHNYTPVIATDGAALLFLQKEFPKLETVELPSYDIGYAKNLKSHLVLQTPKILKTMRAERKIVEQYVRDHEEVIGVISDNRFGVRSTLVPSVYITHQVNVLSGFWTFLTSAVHQKIIEKFDECWIPDEKGGLLSGKLSISTRNLKQKYIGVLSRFSKEKKEVIYDVAIILSGPEPHRSQLEEKLLSAIAKYQGRVVLIRGVVESEQKKICEGHITTYNYVLSQELQEILNRSKVVVSRSGYSSVMDYAMTGKKAVIIPTKGQTEQEYISKYLAVKGDVISVDEHNFSVEHIQKAENLRGLRIKEKPFDAQLFSFFKRK